MSWSAAISAGTAAIALALASFSSSNGATISPGILTTRPASDWTVSPSNPLSPGPVRQTVQSPGVIVFFMAITVSSHHRLSSGKTEAASPRRRQLRQLGSGAVLCSRAEESGRPTPCGMGRCASQREYRLEPVVLTGKVSCPYRLRLGCGASRNELGEFRFMSSPRASHPCLAIFYALLAI